MNKFEIDLELLKSNNITLVQFVTLINIYNIIIKQAQDIFIFAYHCLPNQ